MAEDISADQATSDDSTDRVTDQSASGAVDLARGTIAAATRFVRRHGGSATAVIEPVGASGVRVLMVGAEGGIMGDQVVDDVATAHALVDAVDGLELGEWDRELSAEATTRPGHWRKMAGWVART